MKKYYYDEDGGEHPVSCERCSWCDVCVDASDGAALECKHRCFEDYYSNSSRDLFMSDYYEYVVDYDDGNSEY